jgi:flagellin
LKFTGTSNQSIEVQVAGDIHDSLGLGSWSAQSNSVVTGDTLTAATGGASTITVKIGSATYNVAIAGALADAAAAALDINTTNAATNGIAALNSAGVTITNSGNKLVFTATGNQQMEVSSADSVIAASLVSTGATSRSLQTSTSPVPTTGTNTLGFSINGGQKILVSFAGVTGSIPDTANNLQAAINANTELKAAGLTVDSSMNITSGNQSVNFRVNVEGQSGVLGFGATGVSSAAALTHTGTAAMTASSGASQTGLGTSNDVFSFAGLRNAGAAGNAAGASADQQVLSFSANDANGALQSASVTLSASNAGDVNAAVTAINKALQDSGNSTLKSIVAVKETNAAGTAEGIRFISSANNFSVNVGMAANDTDNARVGLYDGTTGVAVTQGMTVNSSASGAIDISSSAGAKQAVTALGQAVKTLGSAQAAIGKGQNQLGYAINLANSQISNFSSAQAQIRDADVASEAANLSKAQVLQQASIAAMAQANSAPQAVLSLLKG